MIIMLNSTDKSQRKLELCDPQQDLCIPLPWEIVLLLTHVLTIPLNIIHMIMLRKLNLHNDRFPYYMILCFMSVTDILVAASQSLKSFCPIRDRFIGESIVLTGILHSLTIFCRVMPFYVFLCAGYERYAALCEPLKYKTNKAINNIGKILE